MKSKSCNASLVNRSIKPNAQIDERNPIFNVAFSLVSKEFQQMKQQKKRQQQLVLLCNNEASERDFEKSRNDNEEIMNSDEEEKIFAAYEILKSALLGEQTDYARQSLKVKEYIGTDLPLLKVKRIVNCPEHPYRVATYSRKGLISRHKMAPRSWSLNEDERLLAAIYLFGMEDWHKIAKFVGNDRTKGQCSQRWYRGLDPQIVRGPWTKDEERLLLKLVAENGDKSWKKISSQIKNRSDVQCRYTYRMLVKQMKKNCQKNSTDQLMEPQSPLSPIPPPNSINNSFVKDEYVNLNDKENSDSQIMIENNINIQKTEKREEKIQDAASFDNMFEEDDQFYNFNDVPFDEYRNTLNKVKCQQIWEIW